MRQNDLDDNIRYSAENIDKDRKGLTEDDNKYFDQFERDVFDTDILQRQRDQYFRDMRSINEDNDSVSSNR